mmetsp:Transcript_11837/g.17123  ORF Transcript_11837/g.17123 Transcript_11837/m.17123 type:complete len:137 (-) Transcript_11837:14-424(-)
MKLELNGKESCSKRTCHFNIKYFFITGLIKNGDVTLKYCPTEDMTGDYMTKTVVGQKFVDFHVDIMNLKKSDAMVQISDKLVKSNVGQQECVAHDFKGTQVAGSTAGSAGEWKLVQSVQRKNRRLSETLNTRMHNK